MELWERRPLMDVADAMLTERVASSSDADDFEVPGAQARNPARRHRCWPMRAGARGGVTCASYNRRCCAAQHAPLVLAARSARLSNAFFPSRARDPLLGCIPIQALSISTFNDSIQMLDYIRLLDSIERACLTSLSFLKR